MILYNVPESAADDSKLRIEHDKERISAVFSKIQINCPSFKAFRLGRSSNRGPRPLKVALFDASLASLCLRNRKYLDDDVKIRSDLTLLQREQLKKAHVELTARSVDEPNLHIQYIKGIPKVVQQRSRSRKGSGRNTKN